MILSGIRQGVKPSAHEPVHKHEDDRRRVKLVQGVTACDRVNARQNPIRQGVKPSAHEPVNSGSRLRAKQRFLRFARKFRLQITGKTAIFGICP